MVINLFLPNKESRFDASSSLKFSLAFSHTVRSKQQNLLFVRKKTPINVSFLNILGRNRSKSRFSKSKLSRISVLRVVYDLDSESIKPPFHGRFKPWRNLIFL